MKRAMLKRFAAWTLLGGLIVGPPMALAAVGSSALTAGDIPGVLLPKTQPVTGTLNSAEGQVRDHVYRVEVPAGRRFWAVVKSKPDFDLYVFSSEASSVAGTVPALAYSENARSGIEWVRYRTKTDRTLYVDVCAFDGVGEYALTYGMPAKEMRFAASAPKQIDWAQAATISGLATSASTGRGVSGVSVHLLERKRGASGYTFVSSKTSSKTGAVSFRVKPKLRTSYRLLAPGNSDYGLPADPPALTIAPRALVSTPTAPPRIKRDVAFRVSGTILPVHATGVRSVRVYCEIEKKGAWVVAKKVWATNRTVSGKTVYEASVRLGKGRWRITARHPDDGDHAASVSEGALIRTVK